PPVYSCPLLVCSPPCTGVSVEPRHGIRDIRRTIPVPDKSTQIVRPRPHLDVNVRAQRVEPTAEILAGALERAAVLEELAIRHAIDSPVGWPTDPPSRRSVASPAGVNRERLRPPARDAGEGAQELGAGLGAGELQQHGRERG